MKLILLLPRILLFLVFIPVAIFIAVFPYSLVQFLAYRERRREYAQMWRTMWRWTIDAPSYDDERPSLALLIGLSAVAVTAIIVTVRIVF